MENSLFKHILLATFVTIAMVKLKLMPEFNIWVNLLINKLDEIDERQHSVSWLQSGQNLPLNAGSSLPMLYTIIVFT